MVPDCIGSWFDPMFSSSVVGQSWHWHFALVAVEGRLSCVEEVESPGQVHGLWMLCPDPLRGQVLCKSFELWGFGKEQVAHVSS